MSQGSEKAFERRSLALVPFVSLERMLRSTRNTARRKRGGIAEENFDPRKSAVAGVKIEVGKPEPRSRVRDREREI